MKFSLKTQRNDSGSISPREVKIVLSPADYDISSFILGRLKVNRFSLSFYDRSISMPAVCFCMKLLAGMFISLLLVFWVSRRSTPSWVSISPQGYSL